MASKWKQWRNFRNWNDSDSKDPSDKCKLYEGEKVLFKSQKRCRNSFTFCLAILGFVTIFLFGILVGFYVRESQKVSSDCSHPHVRRDGLDHEKVQSVHQNIMYYMSSESIKLYERKLQEIQRQASSGVWEDSRSADFVAKEFKKFGLDNVRIEEHSVVVTYPDPSNPSRLEFLDSNNTVTDKVTGGSKRNILDNKENKNNSVHPCALFSPSGVAEGKLVYLNHGEYLDYLHLRSINICVNNRVILVRHGKSTDSRKVQLAEKYGASGVLLFCHPDDCLDDEAQMTSVADFSGEEPYYPVIPVQTVSQAVAARLLRNLSTTSLPPSWLPGVRKLLRTVANSRNNTAVKSDEGAVNLRLTVNAIRSTIRVKNVIGTLQGGTESDRYVMLGSTRKLGLSNSTDCATAVLLEIAKSLAFIRNTEGWVPRRGIKICSWGGGVLSSVGVMHHILTNRENLEQNTVTSLSIDLHQMNSDMKIVTSPGLVNLVRNAVQMVPNPENPENSIGDSWPALSVEELLKKNSSVGVYRGLWGESFPFLSSLGIPSIRLRAYPVNKENYKHLLSHARVLSLILSIIADHSILPVKVEIYIEYARKLVEYTVDNLKQYYSKNLTGSLLNTVKKAGECGSNWESEYHTKRCQDELRVRKLNNILQGLDRHFVRKLPYQRRGYLLSQKKETTDLEVINSAIEEYKLTKNVRQLDSVISLLISSLQNFANSLCEIRQTV